MFESTQSEVRIQTESEETPLRSDSSIGSSEDPRKEGDTMEEGNRGPLIAEIKETPISSHVENEEFAPSIVINSDDCETGDTIDNEEHLDCEIKVEVGSDSANSLLGADDDERGFREGDSSSEDDSKGDGLISVNKRILRSTAVTDSSTFRADEFFTYECVACPEVALKTMLEMKKHFQKHHNSPGYALCCSAMITPEHFTDHLERHLLPEKFTCPHCKVIVPTESLQLHIRKAHSNIRTCTKCSISFPTTKEYKKHHKTVHTEVFKKTCELCATAPEFATEKGYRNHMARAIHKKKTFCDDCKKELRNEEAYQRHRDKRHGEYKAIACDICKKEFLRRDGLKSHLENVHGQNQSGEQLCQICGDIFKSSESLRGHGWLLHTLGDRRFECTECDSKFRRLDKLKLHIKNVHLKSAAEPSPKHVCTICNKEYSARQGLEGHMAQVHDKGKPGRLVCNVCGMSFKWRSMLIKHQQSHSGKRFECPDCLCTYSRPFHLARHKCKKLK